MFKIDEKTQKAIELIISGKYSIETMKPLGFRPPNHKYYFSKGKVWIGRKFVLKKNNACFKGRPRKAVPTRLIGHHGWVIQPRCEPMKLKDFCELMESKPWGFGDHVSGYDINYKNAGYYKGRPVLIDW